MDKKLVRFLYNGTIIGKFLLDFQKILPYFNKKVYVVNSLRDYVEFINILMLNYYSKNKNEKIREKYIFRGFSKISQLRSKIYNLHYKENEFDFVRKFEENACIKLGQFNNPIDLVAAAEHYGTYTRLIDWTTSPLVATLFSLFEENEYNDYYGLAFRNYKESVVLKTLDEDNGFQSDRLSFRYSNMIKKFEKMIEDRYCIDCKVRKKLSRCSNIDFKEYINGEKESSFVDDITIEKVKKIVGYFENVIKMTNIYHSDETEKTYKIARKFLEANSQIFIETNYSNERLRNQRGLFQIDDLSENNIYQGTSILLISKNARKEIIKYINSIGISYYQLMDDPENISKIINKTMENSLPSNNSKIEYENKQK